ncbi:hypothetical protein K435DRAFT_870688 [Dendrothele bispora CBS 962.96]|uniref:Uncharacterized protein n=1 Tax=Dendrothele bispora (strain CBS 962.96) TaxID=1314807 RepID=A0A4S8L609_DENBC|nr:hypothetical protein K435DRAFT_870688 [Dendrothele bispora CBS 962.96]
MSGWRGDIRVVLVVVLVSTRDSPSTRRWFVSTCFCLASENATQPCSSKAPWATPSNSPPIPTAWVVERLFNCGLEPPNFNSKSDSDLDLHLQCVQLGYPIITHTISSIPTMTTPTSFSTQTFCGSNVESFESSSSQRGPSHYTDSLPGDHDTSTTTGSTMSNLTNGKVDKSSEMHSKVVSRYSSVPTTRVIVRSQLAIYLAQANLNSVLFKGFMGNGFTAGGQRAATVNGTSSFPSFEIHNSTSLPSFFHPVENFHGFPTRILGPELMDEFHDQSLRFAARIITETISKIDLSAMSSSSLPVLSRKRLGLRGEEAYCHSGISVCAVFDGAVLIFRTCRNKPLAVIGGGDFAVGEAACTSCSWRLSSIFSSTSHVFCYQ